MLYLKKANFDDIEKEFDFITQVPLDENGFTNTNYACTIQDFKSNILPHYIKSSQGIDLTDGRVPQTEYFLWDNETIVGLFRLRHYLNDFLKNHAGHIGYYIGKQYRANGYATAGLKQLIQKAWQIIPEDEIYMSVNKNNIASLKVQQKNGAYIHHEDENKFYPRISRINTSKAT